MIKLFLKKKKMSKLFIDSKSSKHYYNNIFVCYCTKGFVLLRFTINNIKYEFEETKVLKYKWITKYYLKELWKEIILKIKQVI